MRGRRRGPPRGLWGGGEGDPEWDPLPPPVLPHALPLGGTTTAPPTPSYLHSTASLPALRASIGWQHPGYANHPRGGAGGLKGPGSAAELRVAAGAGLWGCGCQLRAPVRAPAQLRPPPPSFVLCPPPPRHAAVAGAGVGVRG